MAEKKIGGQTYQVGHVLATDAIRLQARLLRLIGGGVDRLPAILKGRKEGATQEDKDAADAAAVAALADIFGKCDPDMVTDLIQSIVSLATAKRPSGSWETLDLDGDFTDRKKDLFPVVAFVLKEVLGDFFSEALVSGGLKAMARD